MKIKCLAIDDEAPALEKLASYIKRVPYLDLVKACDNPHEALEIINRGEVDAIFIDINMPDLSGLQLVESVENMPLVVFITAYAEHAVDAFRDGAVDYLLKPYSFEDFQRTAARIVERYNVDTPSATEPKELFVKVDYRWIKLSPENVAYIQGYGDYLQVHVPGRATPYVAYSTFNAVKEVLTPSFLQVHRSYIVNMQRVQVVERARIITDSGVEIPIGESYKESVLDYLRNKTVGKDNRKPRSGK